MNIVIFLSHNSKDKHIVGEIAKRLEKLYGKENVFYDSWSIQPGDGIIDKMSEGLKKCRVFFYFISNNSLSSKMVTMEWQNILFSKGCGKEVSFIPIKLENCDIPDIIKQIKYIEFNGNIEVLVRQMIEVIEGESLYRDNGEYSNLKVTCKMVSASEMNVIISAEDYMEPISKYVVLFKDENDDPNIIITCLSDGAFFNSKFGININGKVYMGECFQVSRATTPGFPFRLNIKTGDKTPLIIGGFMHAIDETKYRMIPMKK